MFGKLFVWVCLLILLTPAAVYGQEKTPVRPLDTTQNILILGSDQREGDATWRTDTLLLAAVDWNNKQIGLLSIPRDLYVELPGNGYGRINEADFIGDSETYEGGGAKYLGMVVSNTLGIRTQNYIRIKMPAFAQAIDAMGGITITLDAPFHERSADESSPTHWSNIDLPAGKQHLDGHTALLYVRGRVLTNDFDRSRRQQQVVWAMRDRFLELGWITRLPDLWNAGKNLIETDLSWWDILKLAWMAVRLDSKQLHSRTFNYDLLEPFVTARGAQVLRIRDRRAVDIWVDGIFENSASAK